MEPFFWLKLDKILSKKLIFLIVFVYKGVYKNVDKMKVMSNLSTGEVCLKVNLFFKRSKVFCIQLCIQTEDGRFWQLEKVLGAWF